MSRRGALEIVAIVAAILAVRDLLGRLDVWLWRVWPAHEQWAGIPFEAVIAVALVAIALVWPRVGRVPVWPPRSVWDRRTLLVVAIVVAGTEALYAFQLTKIIGGTLALHAPDRGGFFASAVIGAPLVEEWLFRGVLWQAITERGGAGWAALAITSLTFGLYHLPSMLALSWWAPSGVPIMYHVAFGLLVGALRWRTRAIGPGTALHAFYNALYVLTARGAG